MKLGWSVTTLFFVALFGLALWLGIWGAPALSSRPLPLRDALGPGPGFFPMWLSVIGLALCALLLIEVVRTPAAGRDEPSLMPDRGACLRIGAVLALLGLSALMLEPLGFRMTAFAFSVLALFALGTRSIPGVVLFSLAASLGIFHVFYHWLKVPLPIGPYDALLKPIGL